MGRPVDDEKFHWGSDHPVDRTCVNSGFAHERGGPPRTTLPRPRGLRHNILTRRTKAFGIMRTILVPSTLAAGAAALAGAASLRGEGVEEVGNGIERFPSEEDFQHVRVDRSRFLEDEARGIAGDDFGIWPDEVAVGNVFVEERRGEDENYQTYLGADEEDLMADFVDYEWTDQDQVGNAIAYGDGIENSTMKEYSPVQVSCCSGSVQFSKLVNALHPKLFLTLTYTNSSSAPISWARPLSTNSTAARPPAAAMMDAPKSRSFSKQISMATKRNGSLSKPKATK